VASVLIGLVGVTQNVIPIIKESANSSSMDNVDFD